LLVELRRRGYSVVEEPGLRIVREERETNGKALPWVDPAAFLRRAIEMTLADRAAASNLKGWVFFDRSLIDAASGLEALSGEPMLQRLGQVYRYHQRIFLTPPWPEIYVEDQDRRHSLETAVAEYSRLVDAYTSLGYEKVHLPKSDVAARADFVLNTLTE